MAYYLNNTSDASYYSTSYTSGELDAYTLLSQTSANEETNNEVSNTFTAGWGVGGQPGCTVGSSTSLRAEANFGEHNYVLLNGCGLTCVSPGSVSSASPYTVQTPGYNHLSYPEHYWPMTSQYTQSYHSGIVSRDSSFAGMAASEASVAIPAPSSSKCPFLMQDSEELGVHQPQKVPLDCWRADESGSSVNTFYTVSAQV